MVTVLFCDLAGFTARSDRADPLPIVARICRRAARPELAERFLDGADTPAARYQHSLTSARAVLAETHGDLDLADR